MFEIVRRAIRANSTFIKISGVVYAIIIPVLVGVFAVYYEKLIEINPLLFWFPLSIFVGTACLYAFFRAYPVDTYGHNMLNLSVFRLSPTGGATLRPIARMFVAEFTSRS
jgi:hypothetical protein